MNIAELRSTLHEYADELQDTGLHQRAGAARRRATTIRRQRVAMPPARLRWSCRSPCRQFWPSTRSTGPGCNPPTSRTRASCAPASLAGRSSTRRLPRAQANSSSTVRTDGASQWAATCFGVGGAYTLHQSVDGWEAQSPCLDAAPSDPPWGPRLDEGAAALAGTHTMRIWITRTSDGQPAAPAEAVLAAGAYRLPEKAAVVAGAPVYDLEESEGTVWKLAHTSQSEAGARTFTATYDSGDQPVFIEIVTAGSADTPVAVHVDGVLQANGPGRLGADSCWLGSFPAGSHQVRLTVRDRCARRCRARRRLADPGRLSRTSARKDTAMTATHPHASHFAATPVRCVVARRRSASSTSGQPHPHCVPSSSWSRWRCLRSALSPPATTTDRTPDRFRGTPSLRRSHTHLDVTACSVRGRIEDVCRTDCSSRGGRAVAGIGPSG